MELELTIMYIFDLFGTFIFAITGAVKGVRCKLDILGVVVFACTVGCGGGMFRDMLIGATPVAALTDSAYILTCVGTGLAVFSLLRNLSGSGGSFSLPIPLAWESLPPWGWQKGPCTA